MRELADPRREIPVPLPDIRDPVRERTSPVAERNRARHERNAQVRGRYAQVRERNDLEFERYRARREHKALRSGRRVQVPARGGPVSGRRATRFALGEAEVAFGEAALALGVVILAFGILPRSVRAPVRSVRASLPNVRHLDRSAREPGVAFAAPERGNHRSVRSFRLLLRKSGAPPRSLPGLVLRVAVALLCFKAARLVFVSEHIEGCGRVKGIDRLLNTLSNFTQRPP